MTKSILNFFLFALISSIVVFGCYFLLSPNDIFLNWNNCKTIIIVFFLNVIFVGLVVVVYPNLFKDKIDKDQNFKSSKSTEKYRREFLGNVSHELKTPIFNIQGYVETLIEGALYDKSVNKKYLNRTSKSVDRLIYIIKDLESISQLESEELSLEITDWKLKILINEIVDQFEIKAQKKKIQLLHDEKSTDFFVRGDKDKIAQVLSNLISNSIKYGKRGGVTKISCHQNKTDCFVFVKDNGIGIAEKNINRLFERFYRVDKSRSRDQGGTGLGLSIVKHIMEAHNQTIRVKSTLGKGTEFSFSIECSNCNKK